MRSHKRRLFTRVASGADAPTAKHTSDRIPGSGDGPSSLGSAHRWKTHSPGEDPKNSMVCVLVLARSKTLQPTGQAVWAQRADAKRSSRGPRRDGTGNEAGSDSTLANRGKKPPGKAGPVSSQTQRAEREAPCCSTRKNTAERRKSGTIGFVCKSSCLK